MNNRFRTLTIAIPALLVAILLLTTSVAGAQQLLRYDQIPQVDEPLPVDGKQSIGDDPAAEQLPGSGSQAQENAPSSADSASLTATPHQVVSPRDLSRDMQSSDIIASPEAWTVILEEGFESVFPGSWNVFDGNSPSNGEYYWGDDDYKPLTGLRSAWVATGGADGLDPEFFYYPGNMQSWMVYGPFDLSDAVDAEVQFSYWLDTEPTNDWFAGMHR